MNRRSSSVFQRVVCLLMFGAILGLRAEMPPRLRLEKGQKFRFRFQSNTESSMTIPIPDNPQTLNQTVKQTQEIEHRVLDVDEEGIATVETRIVRANVQADMGPLGAFGYDSDSDANDPENPVASAIEKLLNKPFTAKINKYGKIVKIEGFDDAAEGATQGNPLLGQVGGSSKDELLALSQSLCPIYPEEPGVSWSVEEEISVPTIGKVKSRSNYTTLGEKVVREIPCIELEVETAIESDEEGTKVTEGPVEMLVKMDSIAMKGTMAVGAEDGCAVDAKLVTTARMAMTAAAQASEENPGIPPMMLSADMKIIILIQRLKWENDEE